MRVGYLGICVQNVKGTTTGDYAKCVHTASRHVNDIVADVKSNIDTSTFPYLADDWPGDPVSLVGFARTLQNNALMPALLSWFLLWWWGYTGALCSCIIWYDLANTAPRYRAPSQGRNRCFAICSLTSIWLAVVMALSSSVALFQASAVLDEYTTRYHKTSIAVNKNSSIIIQSFVGTALCVISALTLTPMWWQTCCVPHFTWYTPEELDKIIEEAEQRGVHMANVFKQNWDVVKKKAEADVRQVRSPFRSLPSFPVPSFSAG